MSEIAPFKVLYDYADAPTLRAFALSNKRVRYVQGPFGCVSGDTEFLSPNGWIRIDAWQDQLIAQYDAETMEMAFCSPLRYVNEPYKSEMYHFASRGLDMVLTPNHRILFNKKFNTEKMRVITAEEAFQSHQRLAAGWDGMIPTAFEFSGQEGVELSNDELRLMVAVCADGHFPKNTINNRCTVTLRRMRKRIRLSALLTKLGIDFIVRNYLGRPTEYIYIFDAPERNKTLTKYWRANREQLDVILAEMVHWDGCVENRDGVRIFSTTFKPDADFMQYVFASCNIRASISLIHQGINQKDCYNVIENQSKSFVGMRHGIQKLLIKKVWVDRQYCFETETGFFVARRNNKIFITGNSGKSSACVIEIFKRAMEQKPGPDGIRRSRWAVVRNTYGMLRDTTIRTVHDWFPPKLFGEYRITDHLYVINQIPGVHLEVLFRALDRPDQVANLLSLEVTGAWFNEAREIPKAIVDAMDGRIGRYPSVRDGGGGWHGMILDSNPCDTDSWVYKTFEQNCPDTWEIFKQPSGLSVHAENLKHLPKNYYQNLAKGKDEMYVRVYVHGQYGYMITGKPVFASFKDNIHVAPRVLEPIKGLDVLIGMDFGLQPACVLAQLTPTGQLLILDELVSDGMGIRQFSENQLLPLLRRKYFGSNVVGFGDPAGVARAPTDESSCFDVLRSNEIGLSGIEPAPTNALVPRIGAVEYFLNRMVFGEPAFVLSPNCRNIRKAFNGAYHYERDPKAKSGEEYKPTPAKNFASHIMDGMEYLCIYVAERGTTDKARIAFFAQMKNKQHRPSSSTVGY